MPEAISRRIGIAMIFGVLGPAIGAALACVLFFVAMLIGGGEPFTLIGVAAFFLGLGYVFGLGPGFTAGVAYALTPRRFQRLVFSPLYGAAAVWLFYFALDARDFSGNLLMLAAGAAAALTCAAVVRKLNLDA